MNTRSIAQESPIMLPDGTRFPVWQDETDYRKVYYVDQQHPGAADDNPGTEEAPFLTIQRAADLVEPAEKVLIKSGIYRELVQPRRGGTGADGMIAFEAAPGADAIIRGSQVLSATWTNSEEARSVSAWMVDLPEAFFEGDHPFALVNNTDEEWELMLYARGSRDRIPHTLRRAMVFQNGRRLTQIGSCEELPRFPGTFWIDPEHHQLHVNPFDRANPNTCEMEATTQEFLFKPQSAGLGYIRVKGLTFEHAGNGLMCFGKGALTTWGGHHWIIEDNTVRHVNSIAIEIGGRTDLASNNLNQEELRKTTGDHLVLGNHTYDCGMGGIQGHAVARNLIADNHVHDCGWQEMQSYQHAAGIKTVYTADSVLLRNHIHHCQAAPGMWIDVGNWNCRATRNLVHDIAALNGGIFFEKSNAPSVVDHNVVYNMQGGSGVYLRDCDQILIAHNLLVNCDHSGIRMRKTPTRDRAGLCKHNRAINNVLARCTVAFDYEVMENVSDYNVLSRMGEDFSLAAWQASGLDTHTTEIELDIAIDPEAQCLEWSSQTDAVMMVPGDELLSLDYFGRPYLGDEVTVGPFTEGWGPVCRRLRLAPGDGCANVR